MVVVEQAINWAKNQENKWIDVDGAYGAQCVDLIMEFFRYFYNFIPHGNAIDYLNNRLPEGCVVHTSGEIRPGDIPIWKWGSWDIYGHIGYCIAVNGRYVTSVEQNVDGAAVGVGGYARIRTRDDSCLVGFIRPNYEANGWISNDVGWWYKFQDGSYPKDCWRYLNGSWFRFNSDGYALENTWYKDEQGRWYWLDNGGYMASKSWRYIGESWYYFRENGEMAIGWVQYQGRWYFMQESNGNMVSNEYRKIGDFWYMFDKNGEMQQDKKMEIDSSGAIRML